MEASPYGRKTGECILIRNKNRLYMDRPNQFQFERNRWLLLGNVLNEALHGFVIPDFSRTIEVDESALQGLLDQMHTLPETGTILLDRKELLGVRNALKETIRELGIEEFRIRTGYDLEEGETVLRELDRMLSIPK